METQPPLTNTERRDDVLFLVQRYEAGEHGSAGLLDDDEKRPFLSGDTHTQHRLFYRLLCYGALAAQPAPEALVRADWQRLRAAGLPDDIFDRRFDIERFAAAAPVARTDSKGRVRRLPQPGADHLAHHPEGSRLESTAGTGVQDVDDRGRLSRPRQKARPDVARLGEPDEVDGLDRFACVPDGRVRKRTARIGLVDCDERADAIDDMKAVSAGLYAALGLGGNGSRSHFDLPVSAAEQRCEVCDRQRMAECPMPHCRHRRSVLGAD